MEFFLKDAESYSRQIIILEYWPFFKNVFKTAAERLERTTEFTSLSYSSLYFWVELVTLSFRCLTDLFRSSTTFIGSCLSYVVLCIFLLWVGAATLVSPPGKLRFDFLTTVLVERWFFSWGHKSYCANLKVQKLELVQMLQILCWPDS